MFRASLRQLLTVPPSTINELYGINTGNGFIVVGEAGCGEDTLAIVQSAQPDLLLLDLDMPRLSGLDVLRALQSTGARVRTVVLAGSIRKSELLHVIQLGVRSVVLKDALTEILFEAILTVLAGRRWLDERLVADLMETVGALGHPSNPEARRRPYGLTRRERQVLELVVAGYANKEIARACTVSEETIKHHLTRMFDKVGASNRLELAMRATELGLVNERADGVTPPSPKHHPQVLQNLVTSG